MTQTVRITLASPAELLELPSVGPEQARAILDYRTQHGPIRDANQLATVVRLTGSQPPGVALAPALGAFFSCP